MLKHIIHSLFIALFIILAGTVSAGGGETVPTTYLRYIKVGEYPIPVGEPINVVSVEGKAALQWDHRIGRGHTVRNFILEGVDFKIDAISERGSREYRSAKVGDKGVILTYGDYRTANGGFGSDGIVDLIYMDQYREWNEEQLKVMELYNQFYFEAKNVGFIQLHAGGDCPPNHYLINGQRAVQGPYGNTYLIPTEGGELSIGYDGTRCGGYQGTSNTFQVKAGDLVYTNGGNTNIRPLNDQDPDFFCSSRERLVPQWQPTEFVSLKGCKVYSRWDNYTLAVLPRMGFKQEIYYSGGKSYNFFLYWSDRSIETPQSHWEAVGDQITIGESDVFSSTLQIDQWFGSDYATIAKIGERLHIAASIGKPIVFLPSSEVGDYSRFDWKKAQVFRPMRNGDAISFERLVWDN